MTAMKTALKIAYIGNDFHGSQSQPGLRTVEGDLKKGLVEHGIIGETTKISMSGRTDAGVHALCQVVSFEPLNPRLAEPRIINSRMPKDLWVYAKAEVPDGFDPRRDPVSREYRYLLYAPDVIEQRIVDCAKLFPGTHDFTNFSSLEPGKNPVRTIKNIGVVKKGDFYIIDIEADSFLWNMVRKIVTGLSLVGSGKRPLGWIEEMFDPAHREGVPPAPASGLYLMKVNYEGVDFIEDEYSKSRACQRMVLSYEWHYTMAEVYREFRDAMK